MTNLGAFTSTMQQVVVDAANRAIAILSVTPFRSETDCGYIQIKKAEGSAGVNVIRRFVEKPDTATAQAYLSEGGCCWGVGIFVFKASDWLNALEQFCLGILQATEAAWAKRHGYSRIPTMSDLE